MPTQCPNSYQYTTDADVDSSSKLKSVTQENDLDEFLNTARLAGTDFKAGECSHHPVPPLDSNSKFTEKQNVSLVQPTPIINLNQNQFLLTPQEEVVVLQKHVENHDRLRVPRRSATFSLQQILKLIGLDLLGVKPCQSPNSKGANVMPF
jgi:hypothetical protein